MASQANAQARIAKVQGIRQRLSARKSAAAADQAEEALNREINANLARLDAIE
jgi:hypothetical protein